MNQTRTRLLVTFVSAFVLSATTAGLIAQTEAAPSAPPSEVSVPAPIEGKGYHLVKNWDFSKTVTNKDQLHEEFFTRYVYNNGTLDYFNDEWERYRDNNNHVFEDGVLNLVARVPGTDGLKKGLIESGMLRSKWNGKYGYYECRMKVPRGRGMWPAFWLYPADGKGPAEIDIVEVVNNGNDTTRASFHFTHTKKGKESTITSKLDKWGRYDSPIDYADDYHTFAVEWTPGFVTHYVDGQVIVSRKFEWLRDDGTEAGPTTVLANLAVGGGWPKPPESMDDFPAKMAIQYIRVWQQDTPPAQ